MANYADLLNVNADAIERPKPLPVGTYTLQAVKHEFGESSKKGTPYCQVYFRLMAPGSDVDTAMLSGVKLDREIRDSFYLTPDAMFRFKEFMEKCGITLTGAVLGDKVPEIDGKTIDAFMTQEPDKDDPKVIYNRIKSYTKSA